MAATTKILKKIKDLEVESLRIVPTKQQREEWSGSVMSYCNNFLENIHQEKAYNAPNEKTGKEQLDITEDPKEIDKVMNFYKEHVANSGTLPSGTNFSYIPSGFMYPSALADYLADVNNLYSGVSFNGKGAVALENHLLKWMCKMIGYNPATSLGNLTSGGSIANLTAITTARDAKKISSKEVDISVVYVTACTNHSVHKALSIVGLREAPLREVPMDADYRMDPQALRQMIIADLRKGLKPFLVVVTAGTTGTGAVDPLEAIAKITTEFDLWLHVDAAYGGFFMLVHELQDLFRGIELADSVTMDPHKGLFLPYGTGAILLKDCQKTYQSFQCEVGGQTPSYLQPKKPQDELGPADLSPELSKPFRGLRVWLPLQLIGIRPFRACLEEMILLCRYFYEKIKQIEGFEVGPYPQLSIVIFRFVPPHGNANEFNEEIVTTIAKDGRLYFSATTLNGVYWIRLVTLNPHTKQQSIDMCLDILKETTSAIARSKNMC